MINLVCFFILFYFAFSFQIEGYIYDENEKPIVNCTVYIPELSVGDYTNEDGKFFIKLKKTKRKVTLVAEHINYKSGEKTIELSKKRNIKLYLVPKIEKSDLVEVTAESVSIIKSLSIVEIREKEIYSSGSQNVSELLENKAGIVQTENNGLMIRGFDPRYTLIMINGEALLGDEGKSFDISSISSQDIKKIEILKGPSSFLYGDKALAGSVNIILHDKYDQFTVRTNFKYKSYLRQNSVDFLIANSAKNWNYKFFGDYLIHSNINKEQRTFQPAVNYQFSPDLKLNLFTRYRKTSTSYNLGSSQESFLKIENLSFSAKLNYQNINANRYTINYYRARYKRENELYFSNSNSTSNLGHYDEGYQKISLSSSILWMGENQTQFEFGLINNSIDGNFIRESKRAFQHYFTFATVDYSYKSFKFLGGIRYDKHNLFGSHISPQYILEWKISDSFKARLNKSSGFKAPNFEELYFYYASNSTLNYLVVGANELNRLLKTKQLDLDLGVPRERLGFLKPESSSSYSLKLSYETKLFAFAFDIYRNKLKNHVVTRKIGLLGDYRIKTFSYYNIDEIITQGIELSSHFLPIRKIRVDLDYNYLDSFDPSILELLKNNTRIIRSAQDETFLIQSDYLGLFNRSKHRVNLSVRANLFSKFTLFSALSYFSSHGFEDNNFNSFYDRYDTILPSYFIWNASIDYKLPLQFKINLRVNNILNEEKLENTLATHLGRNILLTLSYTYK